MNFTALIGIITGIAITSYAILTSAKNPIIFADQHGIVIVIGGTLTVALISFPFSSLVNAVRILARKLLGGKKTDFLGTIKIIVGLADTYRVDPKKALANIPTNAHPFLRDGMTYLVELGFSADEITDVLTNALNGKKSRDEKEIKVWHTISRFPPAFGLLGATVGMISLLQGLSEPGAQERIGGAMATALVATFYGLVVANFLLLPITEKLSETSTEDILVRKIIKEGVILIQEKRHPLYIEEYLKSFLSPNQRKVEMFEEIKGEKNAA